MKFTLALTLQCNLACTYCYINKGQKQMSPETAGLIVDLIFQSTPPGEKIDIGFFGGGHGIVASRFPDTVAIT